jgi:hypothetical protein
MKCHIGVYVDPAVNYEATAQAWAERIDQPFSPENLTLDLQVLNSVFRGIYPETIEAIEVDPHHFADRVAAYRHAAASTQPEY